MSSNSSPNGYLNTSKVGNVNTTIVRKLYIDCLSDRSSFYDDRDPTNSDGGDSSDGMEIVISDSPIKQKKEIDLEDKRVLENLEEEIDKQLDEKAAKSNLTATNVKNILKHVISNEHVLAMVRHTVQDDDDESEDENLVYEPKLTRAKAKELLEKQKVSIPWVKPVGKHLSKVHLLIDKELPEDSDDDEYVPQECESEDERERSDLDSEPATPQTPLSVNDSATQTNWTDDGIFKIPLQPDEKVKSTDDPKEIENIALRTRSKLSLSDTPLENIEEAFIPPDITTDMYDFECDNEDWRDFLKKFTRPLDEAVQGTQEDDDETDPEYNVLADEEVEVVDHEELREDKAVKVTKKELNSLVAELFDYNELFQMSRNEQHSVVDNDHQTETSREKNHEFVTIDEIRENDSEQNNAFFTDAQRHLFDQQMRQHVQIATQSYIQTYRHPVLAELAQTYKNFLLTISEMGKFKQTSAFHVVNLSDAVELIERWEKNNSQDVKDLLQYFQNIINKNNSRKKGNTYNCILNFPPYIMKTISESNVFIYPNLLPKIPFRFENLKTKNVFLPSENSLIALGLEQFEQFAEEDKFHKTRFGKMRLSDAAFYISKYMMPIRESNKIYYHIKQMNEKTALSNPIKNFLKNRTCVMTEHIVVPLEHLGIVPPCLRPPDSLPYQWKMFIYPPEQKKISKPITEKCTKKVKKQVINVQSNPVQQCLLVNNLGQVVSVLPVRSKVPIPRLRKSVNTTYKNKRKLKSNTEKKNKRKKKDSVVVSEPVNEEPGVDIHQNTGQQECERTRENNSSETSCADKTLCSNCLKIIEISSSATELTEKDNPVGNLNQSQPTENINYTKKKDTISSCSITLKRLIDLVKVKINLYRTIYESFDRDMLPSMPHLLTPCKTVDRDVDVTDKSKDRAGEIKQLETEIVQDYVPDEAILNKKDSEEELNALMVASSTIQKCRKLPPSSTEKRKQKQKREYNATLAMLSPEDPNVEDEKATNYARAYYDKVQEKLEFEAPCDYQRFMEALNQYNETTSSVTELYEKVESILNPKYPELLDEFLTFLTPEQAKQIGKLVPHFMMTNMSIFLRKLEIYFSNQPAQLRKIFNSLMELANNPVVKIENVKSTILPLLKGNSLLIDWFLQMFPSETPPESLMTDWETIQCDDENVHEDHDTYEYITLPEVEDPYGGPNCICKCHQIDDEMYASRARHCIPCGTKFLQGRVYVQTGKGLRLANVTFNNNPNSDHSKRLSVRPSARAKKKSETSPSKNLMSPIKEEEARHGNESEDEKEELAKPLKKTLRVSSSPKIRKRNRSTPKQNLKKPARPPKDTPVSRRINLKSTKVDCVGKELDLTDGQVGELGSDDRLEVFKTESETECDLKSPGHSTESMDTCEESSQDTINHPNSDNDSDNDSIVEVESISDGSEESGKDDDSEHGTWTRHEDKIILQLFQEHGDAETLFEKIQQSLTNRTIVDIKQRFHILLNLLKKIKSVDSSM